MNHPLVVGRRQCIGRPQDVPNKVSSATQGGGIRGAQVACYKVVLHKVGLLNRQVHREVAGMATPAALRFSISIPMYTVWLAWRAV